MSNRLTQLILLVLVLVNQAKAETGVKGVAVSCELGRKAPVVVDIYILDSAKVPRLLRLIRTRESWKDDPEGKFPPWFAEVMRIVKGTTPLLRTKTDRLGSFKGVIPDVRNIVVFGYAEVEDHPYFYDYEQLAISGRSNVNVVLDFGHYCSPSH